MDARREELTEASDRLNGVLLEVVKGFRWLLQDSPIAAAAAAAADVPAEGAGAESAESIRLKVRILCVNP